MRKMLLLLAAGIFLLACGMFSPIVWMSSPLSSAVNPFSSNGERIYFTATNKHGEAITYTGGPIFGGMMMSSSLACVSCHGENGRGGVHYMHMQVMDAPDIRYTALSTEAGEHAGEIEHTGGEYTLDVFQLAVIEGKHPNGDALNVDMPRWLMNAADLEDLLSYLKTLP